MLNVPEVKGIIAVPDLGLVGDVDVFGAFGPSFSGGFQAHLFIPLVLLIFSLLLADFFDTMGTMVAVGAQGNLLDDRGQPQYLTRILTTSCSRSPVGTRNGSTH